MRLHAHTDCLQFSGSEITLVRLLPAVAKLGIEVRLTYVPWPEYVPGLTMRLPASIERQPVPMPDPDAVVRLASPRGRMIRFAAAAVRVVSRPFIVLADTVRLRSVFRSRRPDLVQINNGGFPGGLSCNAAALAARLAGIKNVVYVVNNLALGYQRPFRWIDWPIDRLVARCVSVFVTGSEAARDQLSAVLRLPPERSIAIPNTILEPPVWPEREAARAALGLAPSSQVLAVVARLEERKGHRHLFDALTRLLDAGHTTTTLLVAGDGPLRDALAEEVTRLRLSSVVRFLGSVEDVWSVYRAADVVVLPSVGQEDFPVTIVEAMAAGRPLVATRVAGIPEQVEDQVTGLLVAPGDASALATAISFLLADESTRLTMGSVARGRFEERFAADVVIGRYLGIYRDLSGREPRR